MGSGAETLTSLRNERKPCHFWVDNEVADCYQPIVGADAIWVYCRIARNAHGAWIVSPKRRDGDTRLALREMAEWCGKSVDTVWRCLQILEHVGLLRAVHGAKAKGRYALADVKELVTREGAQYDSGMGSFRLPEARVAELKDQVRALRAKLARKKATGNAEAAVDTALSSVAQSDSLDGDLFAVSEVKCDSSVAQSDKSVALRALPSNTQESKTAKQTTTPQPPAARGERTRGGEPLLLVSEPSGTDKALKRMMDTCGFTAKRLRWKLHAVMKQREGMGELSEEIADRMIDAWQRYGRQGERLFRHRSAAEFFEGGLWLNSNLWDWDAVKLREEQQVMNASVGSRRW